KARVLVSWLTDANATELIAIAETTPAGRLGAAIAAWAHRNDDQELIEQHQREARSCTWRTEGDGTVTLTARLTPAAAGAVCAVIDAQVTRSKPTAAAPDTDNGAPADPSQPFPPLAQQRADALVSLLTHPGARSGGVDAEVLVHVRANGNTLTDGTPLSDHTVARMLPDAFVALLIHDAADEPIDASPRRRFPTPRQRRVVDARQDQCQQPGCGARDFLEYDHIHPYTRGGPTVLDNLQRLCGPHNRAKAATLTASTT
ncbi:MAG TPA: HNH endonuclease, partial [Acidimicrobiales bacterium]|nr:HNH endonuclease [Acidimicrobiales bacterium]